jgi:hypothetical protein
MKICSKCKQEKPLDQFHKNKKLKDGLSVWCSDCHKLNKKEHYKNNKEQYSKNVFNNSLWLLEIKMGLQCEKCGENHPAALDFHHLDPNEKELKISSRVTCNSKKKEKILEEIKKCIVLCANCHRKEHATLINEYLKQRETNTARVAVTAC